MIVKQGWITAAQCGARIRLKRQWLGMTASELARAAEMSKGYLSEVESGRKGQRISGRVLARLADALGVTVEWLLAEEVTA